VIAVPSDGDGPYGILSASSMANVTFTDVGGGVYTINVTASKAVDNNRDLFNLGCNGNEHTSRY
jgi:hypothetical protein